GPGSGKLLNSGDSKMEAIARDELKSSRYEVPEALRHRMRASEIEYVGIRRVFVQHCAPSGELRLGDCLAGGRAFENGIHEIAHRVDFLELSLFDVAAKFFLDLDQQLDTLH